MIGGPLALLIVGTISPEIVGGTGADAVWRGLATVAGSWIGGGANQTAMLEVFEPSTDLFGAMVTVDIIVANIWLAFFLYGAGISDRVDAWFKADASAITELKNKIADYQANIARIPTLTDLAKIAAVAFIVVAIGHMAGDAIGPWVKENSPQLTRMSLDSSFFWIVIVATTGGLILSFTNVRKLEGAGASKVGSLFLYILVMTIGMKMNIASMLDAPGYFVIGAVWILIHVSVLLLVGKIIKAPFFFIAVGQPGKCGWSSFSTYCGFRLSPGSCTCGRSACRFWLCAGHIRRMGVCG